MSAKARWSVERFVRQIRENLDRNGTFDEQRTRLHEKIAKALSPSPTLDGLHKVAIQLEFLGSLEGQVGVLRVAQGEPAGWEKLQLSHGYLCRRARIHEGLFRRGIIPPGFCAPQPQNLLARCLAHSMATLDDPFALWAGDVMVTNDTDGGGLFTNWRSPFEPFMARLYARWKKRSLPPSALPGPPLGVFQEVLDHWEGPAFGDAVETVCQFHADHSIFGQTGMPEFMLWPHNVFPAEILAIRRVRQEEGLDWPSIKHPVFSTPFAAPPLPLPPPTSDLLERIMEAMRSCLQEVAPCDT